MTYTVDIISREMENKKSEEDDLRFHFLYRISNDPQKEYKFMVTIPTWICNMWKMDTENTKKVSFAIFEASISQKIKDGIDNIPRSSEWKVDSNNLTIDYSTVRMIQTTSFDVTV